MTQNLLLDLLILTIPVSLAGLWWTGSKARELAITHAQRACKNQQLQFLDQTVVLTRQRLTRNNQGTSCFRRDYLFEFTSEGQHRDSATVSMLGHQLLTVNFPYIRDSDGNRTFTH